MIVYGLTDPRTNELRYVGKTDKGLEVRLQQHLQPAYLRPNTHKNAWIKLLKREALRPDIFVIEETQDPEAEQFWISYYKSIGCDLTNGTVGGEGWKVGTKHSEAAKKKISEAHMGRKKEYETWNKGKTGIYSEETLKKMSESKLHRSFSAETREKISKAHGGKSIIDSNGVVYPTIAEAARRLKLQESNINAVIKGRARQTGGYTFKYAE